MSYRYFLRKFGDYYSEIFRIPVNGKNIINNILFLEKYISNDKWSNDSKEIKGLLEDISTGYFTEISDETTEVIAFEIIRMIDEAKSFKD
jgi:hypothetical protein